MREVEISAIIADKVSRPFVAVTDGMTMVRI